MRSSKSRSRSKPNRNRSNLGNVVNRVFDSSGPEGKVRGTPQQIIDKYNQLARDAQLSNDRVAAENFQQHAEHYLRMLAEAQREQDARRDQQERENRERQAQRDRERTERDGNTSGEPQEQATDAPRQDQQPSHNGKGSDSAPQADPAQAPQPDIIDVKPDEESGLVETPENAPKPRKPRAPRKPRKKPETADSPSEPTSDAAE